MSVVAGTFDAAATTTPGVIDVVQSSATVDSLLSLLAARFDVVTTATKVVSISTTQQPNQPVQVSFCFMKYMQGALWLRHVNYALASQL